MNRQGVVGQQIHAKTAAVPLGFVILELHLVSLVGQVPLPIM